MISGKTFYKKFISSAIRQKDQSQNRCYKKTKHAKFFEKRTFLTPWYTCAYQGIKNVCFSKTFFLITPVLRFTLLLYCRGNMKVFRETWRNVYSMFWCYFKKTWKKYILLFFLTGSHSTNGSAMFLLQFCKMFTSHRKSWYFS